MIKRLGQLLLSLSLVLFSTSAAWAQSSDEISHLAADQTVERDYFAASGKVIIDGTVNGDVYVFGGDIEVNGKVNGDLIAAGGNISVRGEVTQDIRAAGGNLDISGKVGRNLSISGGSLKLGGNDPINGSVWVAGGSVSVRKPVQKDAHVASGSLYADSSITGTLDGYLGNFSAGKNLKIGGDLNYRAEQPVSLPPEASVSGKINFTPSPSEVTDQRFIGSLSRGAFYFSLYANLALFLIGWLLWYLLPKFSRSAVDNISKRTLMSALVGLITLATTPFLFIILLITVVGIPLALLLVLDVLITSFVAQIYAASWLGQALTIKFGYDYTPPISLLIGLLVLFILSLIPVVNAIAGLLVLLIGLGALLKTTFDFYQTFRKEKLL